MEQLTYRPCRGEADIASIMELVRACRTSGPPYHWLPGHELRRRLGGGLAQEAAETRLWLDGRGDLVAFGSIWDGSLLVFGVEPGVQHYEDLLLRVLSWGRARVRELGRLHGEQAVLCVPLHADDAATGAVLEREGWVDLVGTRREYRALGLARALLLLLLQRLEAYELGTAWLLVDGANTAALGIFGSAGFRHGYTVRWYIHELGG
jgi:GNAT superfamily N-acetyltransferase